MEAIQDKQPPPLLDLHLDDKILDLGEEEIGVLDFRIDYII